MIINISCLQHRLKNIVFGIPIGLVQISYFFKGWWHQMACIFLRNMLYNIMLYNTLHYTRWNYCLFCPKMHACIKHYGLSLKTFIHNNLPLAGFELGSLGLLAGVLLNKPHLLDNWTNFSVPSLHTFSSYGI